MNISKKKEWSGLYAYLCLGEIVRGCLGLFDSSPVVETTGDWYSIPDLISNLLFSHVQLLPAVLTDIFGTSDGSLFPGLVLKYAF